MSSQLSREEVEAIFAVIREKVISAVESGKDINISWQHGFRDILPGPDNIRRFEPTGEFLVNFHIPADL